MSLRICLYFSSLRAFNILCFSCVFCISLLVFFCDFTDHPAGIPRSQYPWRNIPVHHAACTDDRSLAYRHARQHTDTGSYPYVIAYRDGACIFQSLVPALCIQRMPCRIKAAVRGHKYIVAELHRGFEFSPTSMWYP